MEDKRLFIKLSSMKSIIRLITLILICFTLAGSLSSCAVFDKSSVTKQNSFKHKKPLPKKWIIDNGSRPNAK
jgi:hypothetical protein